MAKRQSTEEADDLSTGAESPRQSFDIDRVARALLSTSDDKKRGKIVNDEIETLQELPEEDRTVRICILNRFLANPASALGYVSAPDPRFLKKVAAKTPDIVLGMDQPDEEVLSIALSTKIELLSQFGTVSEEVLILVVQRNPYCLISIENPGENVQMAAAKSIADFWVSDGYAAKFVAKLTFDSALKIFLRKFPLALPLVEQHNANEVSIEVIEICLEALKSIPPYHRSGEEFEDTCNHLVNDLERPQLIELGLIYPPAFYAVKNLTEDELAPAVKQYPRLIEKIENPSLGLQKRAVLAANTLGIDDILKYIKNPDEDVVKAVIARYPEQLRFVASPNEELQLLAVRMIIGEPTDPSGKNRIGKKEDSLYQKLKQRLAFALQGVNVELGVQKELVAFDYRFITLIENASAEFQVPVLDFISSRGNRAEVEWFFDNVRNPVPESQLFIVALYPDLILRLPGACQEAIKKAIERNPDLIGEIVDPDPELVRFAVSKKPALAALIAEKFPEIKGIDDLVLETEWSKFSAPQKFPKHAKPEPQRRGGGGGGF